MESAPRPEDSWCLEKLLLLLSIIRRTPIATAAFVAGAG